MNPLGVALVGCGSIASTHARALRELSKDARLLYCVDFVPERAQVLAKQFNACPATLDQALSDSSTDAVVVCTGSGEHATVALQALRSGRHVLIEKPIEISRDRCASMTQEAAHAELVISVVSQHRFDPASERIADLLKAGQFGKLFGCDIAVPWFRTQEYYDEAAWRGTRDLDGGCLRNQGIHTLDLMLWFAGPVRRVWARGGVVGHLRIEAEDHICAALEFSSGAMGTLTCSTSVYPGFPARLSLYGSAGSAVIEGDSIHTLALRDQPTEHDAAHDAAHAVATGGTASASAQSVASADGADASTKPSWNWGDAHRAQWIDFIEACRGQHPPRVSLQDGIRALSVIEAIHASIESGQVVEVVS